jgi:hypothetical protein
MHHKHLEIISVKDKNKKEEEEEEKKKVHRYL